MGRWDEKAREGEFQKHGKSALKCAAAGFASDAGEGGAQCDGEEQTPKPQKRVKGLRAEFLPGWPLERLNVSAQRSSGKAAPDWSCQLCQGRERSIHLCCEVISL